MTHDWQLHLRPDNRTAATFLPPVAMDEAGWDILLALHSDRRCELSLAKLASLASVPQSTMQQWLAVLEQRQLISGARHRVTSELRAYLTPAGRELIDRYLSAASSLRVTTH